MKTAIFRLWAFTLALVIWLTPQVFAQDSPPPSENGEAPVVEQKPRPLQGGWINSKWGDSESRVKKTYGKSFKKGESTTSYIPGYTLLGHKGLALYFFFTKSNKLGQIAWVRNSRSPKELDVYLSFKEKLSRKYGEPEEGEVWRKDLFRDDPNLRLTAISAGHLKLSCVWRTEDAVIVLLIDGEGAYTTQIMLGYRSVHFQEEMEQDTVAKEDSKL